MSTKSERMSARLQRLFSFEAADGEGGAVLAPAVEAWRQTYYKQREEVVACVRLLAESAETDEDRRAFACAADVLSAVDQ